jgi:hypothetical protein
VQEVRRILLEHYQNYIRQKDNRQELQLTSSDATKEAASPKP